MNGRWTFRAACAAVLLSAVTGCRSAATPTFAANRGVPMPESGGGEPSSVESRSTSPPAPAGSVPRPDQVVLPVTGEAPSSRESAFARLLGKFSKPRPIPLPRTDLAGEAAANESKAAAAGELAEAF